MNLKLNNDVTTDLLPSHRIALRKRTSTSIKEERQRTGRFIAILVGILLFLLAIYHAWVRRIPIVASLVVPALIMFVYVGWVLFTANRDKHKFLDAEAALQAEHQAELDAIEVQNNLEVTVVTSRDASKLTSPEETCRNWAEISTALLKEVSKDDTSNTYFIKPVILINDKMPDDPDLKWTNLVEIVLNSDKLKGLQKKRQFKRKFCRSRRNAVFKRSYSIA